MRARIGAVLAVCALTASGCGFQGINTLPLPGTEGTGDDSFQVDVQFANVVDLEPNSEVRIDNVAVGSITSIRLEDWHARVTMSLRGDVRLPANSTAKMSQNSLLGAKAVELSPPRLETPSGRLGDGDLIPLSRTGRFPETEEVLASLSLVLNGGGINHLDDITGELNKVLGGRQDAMRDLLHELNAFLATLDQQKADIVRAIDGLDRLSARASEQREVIAGSLAQLPPAIDVLNRERPDLTNTLTALDDLGDQATQVLTSSREDLHSVLSNLEPTLAKLAEAGQALPNSLLILFTQPAPIDQVDRAYRGDYLNIFFTLDLTLPTLDKSVLGGTPLEGLLSGLGRSRDAVDPLRTPLLGTPPPGPAGDR